MIKKFRHLTLVILLLSFISCSSGELTKSKAEYIIENKLSEKPFFKYGKIAKSFNTSTQGNHDIKFKYQENGVVELIKAGGTSFGRGFKLELTEKGKTIFSRWMEI